MTSRRGPMARGPFGLPHHAFSWAPMLEDRAALRERWLARPVPVTPGPTTIQLRPLTRRAAGREPDGQPGQPPRPAPLGQDCRQLPPGGRPDAIAEPREDLAATLFVPLGKALVFEHLQKRVDRPGTGPPSAAGPLLRPAHQLVTVRRVFQQGREEQVAHLVRRTPP